MSSVVDICNLALAHIGDDATIASIDPPEGSAQAEHCARFYPVARDSLLEMHPWNFALRRISPASLSIPVWSWAYAYAAPSNMLKVLAVLPPSAGSDAESQPYETESADDGSVIIRTDQETASLRYIVRVDDPTRFPPLFTEALSRLLAAYLAGPVIKGKEGRAAAAQQMQMFDRAAGLARVSDANQRFVTTDHLPTWISSR